MSTVERIREIADQGWHEENVVVNCGEMQRLANELEAETAHKILAQNCNRELEAQLDAAEKRIAELEENLVTVHAANDDLVNRHIGNRQCIAALNKQIDEAREIADDLAQMLKAQLQASEAYERSRADGD